MVKKYQITLKEWDKNWIFFRQLRRYKKTYDIQKTLLVTDKNNKIVLCQIHFFGWILKSTSKQKLLKIMQKYSKYFSLDFLW
jgi:hypothetical protein